MRWCLVVLMVPAVTACRQDVTVGESPGDSGIVADVSFSIRSRGANMLPGALVIIGSDLPADSSCPLTGPEPERPGRSARLVYARFATFTPQSNCGEGPHDLGPPPHCSTLLPGELPDDCVVYKRWREWGVLAERVLATGGSAIVTKTDLGYGTSRCTVVLDLQFGDSGRYQDTFALDFAEDLPVEPLCTELVCRDGCAAWQRCTSNGCEDFQRCIDHHVSCPPSGAPECCATPGVREFICGAVDAGHECCVPAVGRCDFNENDCCPPNRCSSNGVCGE